MKVTIKAMRSKIESHKAYNARLIDAKEAARQYRDISEYTEAICQEFPNVRISLTDDKLIFRYYRGRGKTFHEGSAKRTISIYDQDILVPQLEEITARFNVQIARPSAFK